MLTTRGISIHAAGFAALLALGFAGSAAAARGGSGGGGGGGNSFPYEVAAVLACPEGGTSCGGAQMNDSATRVVGWSYMDEATFGACTYTRVRAAIWDLDATGAVTAVHALPNSVPAESTDRAQATDVNDTGLVVGYSGLAACDGTSCSCMHARPVTWTQDVSGVWVQQDLPTPTGLVSGIAWSVNNAGWILGIQAVDGDSQSGVAEAVVWIPDPAETSGYRTEILPAPPGGDVGFGSALNDANRALGNADLLDMDDTRYTRPAVWDRDEFGAWSVTLLDTLGGQTARGLGLNADGDVVGQSYTGVFESVRRNEVEQNHAARWRQDPSSGTWLAPEDLGTIDGPASAAVDHDTSGLTVGISTVHQRDSQKFAVTWDGGPPVRLDEQVGGNWTLTSAADVAGDRWILASGTEGSSSRQSVVLVPSSP